MHKLTTKGMMPISLNDTPRPISGNLASQVMRVKLKNFCSAHRKHPDQAHQWMAAGRKKVNVSPPASGGNQDFTPPVSVWEKPEGTFLVVQWLRIHLAMQGTWVRSLVGELKSDVTSGQLSRSSATTEPAGSESTGHNQRDFQSQLPQPAHRN